MNRYGTYAFVADYNMDFPIKFDEAMRRFAGYETEVHYAQSTQLDGRVLFSALIIVRAAA